MIKLSKPVRSPTDTASMFFKDFVDPAAYNGDSMLCIFEALNGIGNRLYHAVFMTSMHRNSQNSKVFCSQLIFPGYLSLGLSLSYQKCIPVEGTYKLSIK